MGIVEQFSLEGLEVVMPARRCQLTVITTAPASRLRSATGAVAPFLTLSIYRPELFAQNCLAVTFVLGGGGSAE